MPTPPPATYIPHARIPHTTDGECGGSDKKRGKAVTDTALCLSSWRLTRGVQIQTEPARLTMPLHTESGFYSMNPATVFTYGSGANVMRIRRTLLLSGAQSRLAFADFPANTTFHTVEYRLLEREVWAQQAVGSVSVRLPLLFQHDALDINQRQIEDEVLALMLRGHSLFTRACCCQPRVDYKRMLELGLDNDVGEGRGTSCPVPQAVHFTAVEIARELGATDLDAVRVGKESIAEILDGGCFFARTNTRARAWQLSDECRVWDRRSLCIYLEMAPRGVDAKSPLIQYPRLREDIEFLRGEGALVWLGPGATATGVLHGRLYASRLKSHVPKCDSDIVAMWRASV